MKRYIISEELDFDDEEIKPKEKKKPKGKVPNPDVDNTKSKGGGRKFNLGWNRILVLNPRGVRYLQASVEEILSILKI